MVDPGVSETLESGVRRGDLRRGADWRRIFQTRSQSIEQAKTARPSLRTAGVNRDGMEGEQGRASLRAA